MSHFTLIPLDNYNNYENPLTRWLAGFRCYYLRWAQWNYEAPSATRFSIYILEFDNIFSNSFIEATHFMHIYLLYLYLDS